MRIPTFPWRSLSRPAFSQWAIAFIVAFALSAVLLFGFIYWQTARYETRRIDGLITNDARLIESEAPDLLARDVALRLLGDLDGEILIALFDASGQRVAGNLAAIPPNLPQDGQAHRIDPFPGDDYVASIEPVTAVARRLPSGDLLVIGRRIDELEKLRDLVLRALELGVVPALALSLAFGAFIGHRAEQRIGAVNRSAELIMSGDLTARLPVQGTADSADRLAGSLNRMLDEIGRLLETVKAAGSDIAHDLRTPLARLRTRLERARESATCVEELRETINSAIGDLDQALVLITTLLRLGEIESGHLRGGFQELELGLLVDEIGDIYAPLAEEKQVAFETCTDPGLFVRADRGLLMEAVANLVQNAIKFTPAGGCVRLGAVPSPQGPTIRVLDNGPGIPDTERKRVFDRFYRLDKSRHIEGSGLGLSLVASIATLHGFEVLLQDAAPGCLFEIVCRDLPA